MASIFVECIVLNMHIRNSAITEFAFYPKRHNSIRAFGLAVTGLAGCAYNEKVEHASAWACSHGNSWAALLTMGMNTAHSSCDQ